MVDEVTVYAHSNLTSVEAVVFSEDELDDPMSVKAGFFMLADGVSSLLLADGVSKLELHKEVTSVFVISEKTNTGVES